MLELYREQKETGKNALPTFLTVIGCLELAAALWDGRVFLNLNSVFPLVGGDNLSLRILFPALMCIAAIYGGAGILQRKASGWNVWMLRHLVLCGLYIVYMPNLLWETSFVPGLSTVLVWRLTIIVFSVVAGAYLYATRSLFDTRSAR